jgi:para-aminobenzoate synthetase component 1
VTPPPVQPLTPAPDPLAACARFTGLPHLVFLDSSARGPAGRYSFLTADPIAVVRAPGTRDPLQAARVLLAPHVRPALPGLPPFQGGLAGYLGYEWGASLEGVRRSADEAAMPDVVLGLYDWTIAWDHQESRAWIVAWTSERLDWVRARLAQPPLSSGVFRRPSPSPVVSNFTRAAYEAAVSRIRDYIAAGDVYQVNLAQRFRGPFSAPPLALYRELRARNPAPFGAFLELDDIAVASISPERFVQLDGAGQVEARPIKGTRPRGATAAADAALARDLVTSAKDRAENVMIVDLLRNDLGKVCRPGSVRVPDLFALESHATVHHLVSTVVGTLAEGCDAFDVIRAAFPGGSVTGAPKIRAMEIIAELEPARRDVYCGAIGYISASGAMDLNIPIRTVVLRDGTATFHAGAGIVWDSEPAAEYEETLAKARTIREALTSPRKTRKTRGPARRPA